MDEDLKRSCKFEIEKLKTNFYFRNTNQKYRSDFIHCFIIKQKECRDKSHEKIKNQKSNIMKIIEKKYAINR